jgi:hypothetical protein
MTDLTGTPSPGDLRQAAEEGTRAKAELAATRRELAMLKAGVDLGSKLGRMFAKHYDGEVDAEAIRDEWSTIAPPPPPAPVDPGPSYTPDEMASSNMRAAMANGSPADVRIPLDPRVESDRAFDDVMLSGGSREEAMAVGFDKLIEGAIRDGRRPRFSSPNRHIH